LGLTWGDLSWTGLDPVVDGVYRQATHARNYGYVSYQKGDKLFFNYRAAGVDSSQFTNPRDIDPHRPVHLYEGLQGDGVFKVLGQDFVYGATANVLRAVFSLKDVRRANGPAGTLRRFKENFIAPFDELTSDLVDAPLIILGDDGKPVKSAEGKTTKIYKYGWKSQKNTDPTDKKEVNTAWKYKYCNPEDEHRLTLWATGLTLNVRLTHLYCPRFSDILICCLILVRRMSTQ
jgi:linoleate 10R-lipoxygenase